MAFGYDSSSSAPAMPSSASKKEEVMGRVRGELAVANAQELLQKMSDKCFTKCISKPGTSLDNSERSCMAKCMDRYMDVWNLTYRSYAMRLQRDASQMQQSH